MVENGPYGVGGIIRILDGAHLCIGVLENYTPSLVAGEQGTYSAVVYGPETIDATTSQTATQGSRTFGGNPVQEVAVIRLPIVRHISDPYPGGWGQRFILATEDAQALLDAGQRASGSIDSPGVVDQSPVDAGGGQNAPGAAPEQPVEQPAPEAPPVVGTEHHKKHKHE